MEMTSRPHHSLPEPVEAAEDNRRPTMLMMAYTHYETDPRVMRSAEAARDGGFAVDVVALRRPGQLPVESVRGVQVFRIQARYRGASRLQYILQYVGFLFRCLLAAARLGIRKKYRVCHVHNMPDLLVFAALVPRVLGAKVILDIHDPMPETYESKYSNPAHTLVGKLLLWQERLSVAFADSTITVSEPFKQGILLKHGYQSDAIGVVSNFADEELFRPTACPPIDGVIRCVFHGTILERYGLGLLIEAVSRVRHRDRLRVRIIGEGDFSASLADLIRTYKVHDVVEFVNRVYPLQEIPKVLSDCHVGLVPLDVAVSPVANYALPLKLVEYTCLGMPTITVRNAAIEYYFRPDECMFFESGDAGMLAKCLDMVAEQPHRLQEYRRKLVAVRARLSWKKEKEKYIGMLKHLTGGLQRFESARLPEKH